MILDALVRHYDQLAEDPESDVAPFGFSLQKIGFALVLNSDGSLHAIESRIDESSGKPRPIEMVVPHPGGKRTSGIAPYFLWDKTAYVLGRDLVEEAKSPKKAKRLNEQFQAFRKLHHKFAERVDHPVLRAICSFLDNWQPTDADALDDFESISGHNMVFCMRNELRYAHEVPELRQIWVASLETNRSDANTSTCLVTGTLEPIARTHPPIKGVYDPGGQAEKSIVSFNKPSFDSMGKEQSHNAPVSERAAFAYATALNRLLANNKHRVQLGDTTCLFWTEAKDSDAPDALAEAMGAWPFALPSAGGELVRAALADFLERFRQGRDGADTSRLSTDDADAAFYILGLAPNAARISVRFWHRCTIGELAARLQSHQDAMRVIPDRPDARPLTIWQLLRETAREARDIPPLLGGAYARAVMLGGKYPDAMMTALWRRIVADRIINYPRAAAIKAWLNRNYQQEITVALDTTRTDTAYLLGRLFATYEKVQRDALGDKLNHTIRDSYLASASATPAGIFPRLYRLNQHHISTLRRDKPGLAVVREKLIGEICDKLIDFPDHFSLQDQGIFALGYYHQTQAFYKSSTKTSEDQTEATTHA